MIIVASALTDALFPRLSYTVLVTLKLDVLLINEDVTATVSVPVALYTIPSMLNSILSSVEPEPAE